MSGLIRLIPGTVAEGHSRSGFDAWDDGMTLRPDYYVEGDPHNPVYARNVEAARMQVRRVMRVCWAPTSGNNTTIRDSSCRDAWTWGLDAEMDVDNQPLTGLRLLNNTFEGTFFGSIVVPVASTKARDIETRGNRQLIVPDNVCVPSILIVAWPNDTNTVYNVVIEDNEVSALAKPSRLTRSRAAPRQGTAASDDGRDVEGGHPPERPDWLPQRSRDPGRLALCSLRYQWFAGPSRTQSDVDLPSNTGKGPGDIGHSRAAVGR